MTTTREDAASLELTTLAAAFDRIANDAQRAAVRARAAVAALNAPDTQPPVVPPIVTPPTPPAPPSPPVVVTPPVVIPIPPATVPPKPSGEVVAELPRITIGVQAPGITGKTWLVATNDATSLQNTLNSAQFGDLVEVTGILTGNLTLPNKSGAGWITVRPSSGRPLAPGSRMTPLAAVLPILQSPNSQPAIQTLPGAHHYRFVGLEIRPTVDCSALVSLGDPQQTKADIPHDLIFDRCYVHGLPKMAVRRGVVLNCASAAVIDSTISEIHDNNGDSQAILGYNGPGPFLIRNNALESSGEVIMFGGADPSVNLLVPSDIEILRNHITSNLAWKGIWNLKNLLELKNAQRVLIEGNVFENAWVSAQTGGAILLKSANQDGGAPWSGTLDVTFRNNLLKNVRSFMTIESIDDPHGKGSVHVQRITIVNNLVLGINLEQSSDAGLVLYLVGDAADVVFAHNTALSSGPLNSALTFGGGLAKRLRYRDNAVAASQYGFKADGVPMGNGAIMAGTLGAFVEGNVVGLLDQQSAKGYPAKNLYPATNAFIGPDFKMVARTIGSDGLPPGADIDAVLTSTAGVVIP